MERVPELSYSHFNARAVLRDCFRRLPRIPDTNQRLLDVEQTFPSDVDVLALLNDTTLLSHRAPSIAAQKYKELHSASANELPDFQEAQARGWFRQVWGEIAVAFPLRDYLNHENPAFKQELREFLYWLTEEDYQVANFGCHGTVGLFEEWLHNSEAPRPCPPVLSGEWIAARLWDMPTTKNLSSWEMRWGLLSRPSFLPHRVWSAEDASEFRDAVLGALRGSNLPGWDTYVGARAMAGSGDTRSSAAPGTLPSDLLGIYLQRPATYHGIPIYDDERLLPLVRLLVAELPHIEKAPVPSATAEALLEVALVSPDVLEAILSSIKQVPEALADFVLCPRAAALVTYLVATWTLHVPWPRNYRDPAGETLQASIFEDCLAVLRHFLLQERVTAQEYARLLVALQEHDVGQGGLSQALQTGIEGLRNLPVSTGVRVRSSLVESGCSDGSSPAFAAMLKSIAVIETDVSEPEAARISSAYRSAITSSDHQPNVSMLDAAAAAALMRLALQYSVARDCLLHPLDVTAEFASGAEVNGVKLGLSLRAHIRVLSRAIIGYPDSVPADLVAALRDAIHSGACNRVDRQQVDAFTFEFYPWRSAGERPVEADLVDAVNRLEAPQQSLIVNALLELEEPLVLAALLQRAPRIYHAAIRGRLEQLTPIQASTPYFVPQIERRVMAFLDLGLPHLAEMYLVDRDQRLQGRTSADLTVTKLRAELQLRYLRNEWQAILGTEIPSGLSREHQQEARRTVDFFRALVLLKQEIPDPAQASAIFLRLYNEQPNAPYAVNLLAARMTRLLGANLFGILQGDDFTYAKEALRHADNSIPDRATLAPEGRAVHNPNCAAMLLAIGRPHMALRRLEELEPAARTAQSMAFEAIANSRAGDHERATALIRSAREQFGSLDIVAAAENHLAHSTPHAGSAQLLTQGNLTDIRAALKLFAELSPERQAAVLVDGALPLEQVVTELFRDSLAAFQRVISFLKLHQNSFHEDDYNGLLAENVQARIDAVFGWQPHEQSPGGFTGAGNAGRRDFVIRRRGVDIVVFEALVSSQPNDSRIVEHLHRLFAYSAANILLHVIYSFRPQVSEMVAAVRAIAAQPPLGSVYVGQRDIPAEGARPFGIRGAYRRGNEDVTVLFFVVDMEQEAQRQASGAPMPTSSSD